MAERKPGKFAKERQFIKDKQIDDLKTPPHSLEAEQSVLGGLLLDNETWDRVAEKTVAEDFYTRSHRLIFETIGQLIELGEPVDLITLSEALENDQKLDDAGGFVVEDDDKARYVPFHHDVEDFSDGARCLAFEHLVIWNHESGYEHVVCSVAVLEKSKW